MEISNEELDVLRKMASDPDRTLITKGRASQVVHDLRDKGLVKHGIATSLSWMTCWHMTEMGLSLVREREEPVIPQPEPDYRPSHCRDRLMDEGKIQPGDYNSVRDLTCDCDLWPVYPKLCVKFAAMHRLSAEARAESTAE